MQNNCSHKDFPLSEAGFDPRDGVLVCAWHGGCFDVRSGDGGRAAGHRAGRDLPGAGHRWLGRARPDRQPGSAPGRRVAPRPMRIEAILFVNWIFWAALSAGTLLVVGVTERLGGTTRGYRLFMAWLLVAFAAVLVASELALPAGVAASATAELRRPLTLAFAAGAVAYLVASLAGWPRSGLAIGSGLIGLAALVVLAAAGGTDNAALFAWQLVLAALALGAVNAGHAARALVPRHAEAVAGAAAPDDVAPRRLPRAPGDRVRRRGRVGPEALEGGLGMLTWLRLGVGILLPLRGGRAGDRGLLGRVAPGIDRPALHRSRAGHGRLDRRREHRLPHRRAGLDRCGSRRAPSPRCASCRWTDASSSSTPARPSTTPGRRWRRCNPALDPQRPYVRAARNGAYVPWDEPVADGDVVAFLPPVSGGSSSLTEAPIDVAALERAVAGPGMGAVVTFVGRARDVADDERTVVELEYEAYAEMAASVLDEIRAEAEPRFGVACAVVHRSGVVPIGEAAVAIVTAARASGGRVRGQSVRDRGDQAAAADLEARALRRRQRVEAARRLEGEPALRLGRVLPTLMRARHRADGAAARCAGTWRPPSRARSAARPATARRRRPASAPNAARRSRPMPASARVGWTATSSRTASGRDGREATRIDGAGRSTTRPAGTSATSRTRSTPRRDARTPGQQTRQDYLEEGAAAAAAPGGRRGHDRRSRRVGAAGRRPDAGGGPATGRRSGPRRRRTCRSPMPSSRSTSTTSTTTPTTRSPTLGVRRLAGAARASRRPGRGRHPGIPRARSAGPAGRRGAGRLVRRRPGGRPGHSRRRRRPRS